jgi:argininosuccinate lyase
VASSTALLTGRLAATPARLLHEEILAPQFRFEAEHLLPHYLAAERALVGEYERMGLLDSAAAGAVRSALDTAATELADADPEANLSDLAFAIERHVLARCAGVEGLGVWHADRSRNDLQATAQRMHTRALLHAVARAAADLVSTVHGQATRTLAAPMPGMTHFQPAQVSTPGFHFAALAGQLLHTLRRLLHTDDLLDACPLGAGAMTGQQLPWDRDRLAAELGFARPEPHALTAVASRRAAAEVTAELSLLGTELSRFVTDLITWCGGDCRYAELPDELAAISSAMPQKKNYPVLERIRGKTAHLTAFHVDVLTGQRNTPYTNLVEVSKEAGAHLHAAATTALLVLRLLDTVVAGLRFDEARMRSACTAEFLGGFALANRLTLDEGVPWRQAQVIAGRYVVAAIAAGRTPAEPDPDLLRKAAAADGFEVADPLRHLTAAFDVDRGLTSLLTSGSAHPDRVAELLAAQRAELASIRADLTARADRADRTAARGGRAS